MCARLPDVWVNESERIQQKTKVVHLSKLPTDTAVLLDPNIYRWEGTHISLYIYICMYMCICPYIYAYVCIYLFLIQDVLLTGISFPADHDLYLSPRGSLDFSD